ncbi:hypothetical protein PG991_009193 [Apiospora marii]|uniref:C2H2-type domain-containing protein n=1 Tax=Apiospora marii TaxID=335849 RepID=A0ABR1RJY1_9PEZI
MRKRYSAATEDALRYMRELWKRFCKEVLEKKPKEAFAAIEIRTVVHFMHWHMNQKLDLKGHTKRGMHKKSSLVTFWRTFRITFQRAMFYNIGRHIDGAHVHNAIRDLAKQYRLSHKKRDNSPLTVEDLKHHIDIALRTPRKNFKTGEQRIESVLFFLLMAPAGARPTSITKIRLGDIRLTLVRDPHGGPPRLLIEFTLVHTKAYLDPKDEKSTLIPEIIWEPTLLLSPHVFLMAVLMYRRAFLNEGLNNDPDNFAKLTLPKNENEMAIPLKKEVKDMYLFRKIKRDLAGDWQPINEHITKNQMSIWHSRIGMLAGFEHATINYSLRYAAGNSVDKEKDVSSSLRNLIMGHAPNSDTFQKHYLNRRICLDMNAIHRGLEPQTELMRQVTSHGHSRSQRRPVKLTPEQSAALKSDAKLVAMYERASTLPNNSKARKEMSKKIDNRRTKLYHDELIRIRNAWTEDQAAKDIDRQLGDGDLDDNEPEVNPDNPEDPDTPTNPMQVAMVAALNAPLVTDIQELYKRRSHAIRMLTKYCDIQECGLHQSRIHKEPAPPPEKKLSPKERTERLRQSVLVTKPGQRLRRCFVCVAKAMRLSLDDPWFNKFCRDFYTPQEASRHFKKVHLSTVKDQKKKIPCPLCITTTLDNLVHFRNHALTVHGLTSNYSGQGCD